MSGPSRPRRSAASSTISYKHLLRPDFALSSSSSSDDGTGDQPRRRKPHALPRSDDSGASDSDWEAERVAEQAKLDKAKARAGELVLSSEEDDEDADSLVEEDEEQDSNAGEAELDDGISIVGSNDGSESDDDRRGGRRRGVDGGTSRLQERKQARIRVVGPGSKSNKPGSQSGPVRCMPPMFQPRTGVSVPFAAVGIQFEPPVRRLNTQSNKGKQDFDSIVYGSALDDLDRSEFLEAWAVTPFGPERPLLHDVGWFKGKWSIEGEEEEDGKTPTGKIRARWGGWYEDLPSRNAASGQNQMQSVNDHDLPAHLPRLVFPSIPIKVDTDVSKPSDSDATATTLDAIQTQGNPVEDCQALKIRVGSLSKGAQGDADGQALLELDRFASHRLDEFLPRKPGYFFAAGAPVSGLDWCPMIDDARSTREYLAVGTLSSLQSSVSHATAPGPSMIQIWSLDTSVSSDLSLSTSEQDKGQPMRFELGLCIDLGDAMELKWCPKGGETSDEPMELDGDHDDIGAAGEEDHLGLLAGVFSDGSLAIFDVPRPPKRPGSEKAETKYIKVTPVMRLTIPGTTCSSVVWASHERVAAGCNNGHVAIWDIEAALKTGKATVRPTHYFPANVASIRSITFVQTPPLSRTLDGSLNLDGEPSLVVTAGFDGTVSMVDLSESVVPMTLYHDRGVMMTVAHVPHLGGIVLADSDACVRYSVLKSREFAGSRATVKVAGSVRSLATSDHHPFVAVAAADGTCTIGNVTRGVRRKAVKGHFQQKVFQLDFNRHTGEYRMIDNFHVNSVTGIDALIKQTKSTPIHEFNSAAFKGAWPAEIACLRTCWHPSLLRASLLATGTAAGLVRIDWVEGGELAT